MHIFSYMLADIGLYADSSSLPDTIVFKEYPKIPLSVSLSVITVTDPVGEAPTMLPSRTTLKNRRQKKRLRRRQRRCHSQRYEQNTLANCVAILTECAVFAQQSPTGVQELYTLSYDVLNTRRNAHGSQVLKSFHDVLSEMPAEIPTHEKEFMQEHIERVRVEAKRRHPKVSNVKFVFSTSTSDPTGP